ncbi:PHP domain-containing protein [Draconibacterium halophilum]|uniref:PHP domain-containing protein n=1 Tax=Draconibacterium halophilum TaxID=2706887 RepID=A0A6C0RGW3_9BACT|nr:PHP domain-containing protein [Draconibacterium halophilum]QIA09236.1 PHP domain-containing protein [Draconibacterium halophilum]
MQKFRADLHIHSVLSPCADLEMAPLKIVEQAQKAGLHIIGITDHNSTLNAKVIRDLALEKGILTLTGVEITTKEEVHCLAFFDNDEALDTFQQYLEQHITRISNPDGHFGYQPVVDKEEKVLELVPYYLTSALKKGISSVQKYVYDLGGIFIPAHVNRPLNGLFSHLGFIPKDLAFDAMGITGNTSEKHVRKQYDLDDNISLVYNSDSHFLEQIGTRYSVFNIHKLSFKEVKKALNQQDSCFVEII